MDEAAGSDVGAAVGAEVAVAATTEMFPGVVVEAVDWGVTGNDGDATSSLASPVHAAIKARISNKAPALFMLFFLGS